MKHQNLELGHNHNSLILQCQIILNEGPILGFYLVSISLMQKHPGDFQFCDHTMDIVHIESSLSAIDIENRDKNGR